MDTTNESSMKGISYPTAKDLAERYMAECQPLLSSKLSNTSLRSDARSIVFSLEVLKRMIEEIEQQTAQLATVDKLGVRFYYGKYPDITAVKRDPGHPLHADLSDLPDAYSGLHTLFMVPTYKDERGTDLDFDPWRSGLDGKITLIKKESLNEISPMTPQINHGNLCPPPFSARDRFNQENGLAF